MGATLVAGMMCAVAAPESVIDKRVARGFAALEKNQHEKALKYFLKAHEENPLSAQIECYVGLGYFKTGKYDQTIEYCERAALHDPSVVDSAFLFYRASVPPFKLVLPVF